MLKDKRFGYILRHESQYKGNTVSKTFRMEALYGSDITLVPIDETEEEFQSGKMYYVLKAKYMTAHFDERSRWYKRIELRDWACVAIGKDLNKLVAAVDKYLTEKEGLGKRYPCTKRSLHKLEKRVNERFERKGRNR